MAALIAVLLLSSMRAGALAPEDAARLDALYLRRNEPAAGQACLRQLESDLAAAPQDEAVLWRLGRSLVAGADAESLRDAKLELLSQAQDRLRQAVALAPRDAQAHYWLARELGDEADLKRSLSLARAMKRELEAAIGLDPSLAAAHRVLADLLRGLPGLFGGDKRRAVREAQEALHLAPNDTANFPSLAQAYDSVGRRQDAIDVLEKAFSVTRPDDPAAAAEDLADARRLLRKWQQPDRTLLQRLLGSSDGLFGR